MWCCRVTCHWARWCGSGLQYFRCPLTCQHPSSGVHGGGKRLNISQVSLFHETNPRLSAVFFLRSQSWVPTRFDFHDTAARMFDGYKRLLPQLQLNHPSLVGSCAFINSEEEEIRDRAAPFSRSCLLDDQLLLSLLHLLISRLQRPEVVLLPVLHLLLVMLLCSVSLLVCFLFLGGDCGFTLSHAPSVVQSMRAPYGCRFKSLEMISVSHKRT